MKPEDRRFANDVAKQLDRRRLRRRIAVYAALATVIVLAALYLTCGRGWGLGGKGGGSGGGPGTGSTMPAVDAGPRRCSIRVTATGITVDGATVTRDQAVTTCKTTTGADVVVTGDARQGDWDELKAALDAANVPTYRRDRL